MLNLWRLVSDQVPLGLAALRSAAGWRPVPLLYLGRQHPAALKWDTAGTRLWRRPLDGWD
jgi:hypothetical protein